MIASICSEPKILEVMKYVNIFISIIRIVVPIILIFSASFKFISVIKTGDEDNLAKVKKTVVTNAIAAVIIFLIPNLVNIIVKISFSENDYKNCLNVKDEVIVQAYEDKMEKLVSKAEETLNIYDYNNAYLYLKNIKDEEKRKAFEERLKAVKEQIDELNKKVEVTSTGLGSDIVPTKELIEACTWVLNDDALQIRLQTCPPGPYKYADPNAELPGGAVDNPSSQAIALKTISLHEYQKGVFFGEEDVMAAPDARYAFMIIYKTVFLHNTVWRVLNNELTFGKFEQIFYNAGSCAQNYRNSRKVAIYDSGEFKSVIDETLEKTRYLVLANQDGTTTDARYYVDSGIEKQIENAGANGTSYLEILESVIKSGNDVAYYYKNARVYDCRNLIEEPENGDVKSITSDIIYLGDSRVQAYHGIASDLGINSNKEYIFATSGAKLDERFVNNMNDAKDLINSNKNKTFAITVNYGVNAPTSMRGYCDYYTNFLNSIDKKHKFIIVSVNPFDENKSVYIQLDDRNENIEKFNDYMKNTCINEIKQKTSNNKVYYCDVYGSIPISEWIKRKYISDDGIHYTPAGYKYIYDYTKKCVAKYGG